MRTLPTLILLSACGSTPPAIPVPEGDARPFDEPSGAGTLHLWAHTATQLTLPTSTTGDDGTAPSSWELGPLTPSGEVHDGRTSWRTPLPFPSEHFNARFRPEGMRLFSEGELVPYDMTPLAGFHQGWKVQGDELIIALRGEHDARSFTLEFPALGEELARLDPGQSGLPAAEYARYQFTRDDLTRPGLLLPAPTTATWSLTVPPHARFDATLELLPHPLHPGASDGAEVRLEVESGGQRKTVSTRRVGSASWLDKLLGTDLAAPWQVDLSRYAGQDVSLHLVTHGGASALHDYVFVGSPTVAGAPEAPPRHIIVLAVDTLRPDHLGSYGYARPTSPELDALAAQSVVFERSWAPAPRTRPSFRSAFTGRDALDAVGAPNTAETFQANGFATAGFVANMHLTPRFGFDQGFDHWELHNGDDAGPQVDRALAWMREHQHEDTFLFLHLMDPHLFYRAPGTFHDLFVDDPDPTLPETFNRWGAVRWERGGELTEQRIAHITGLYDGEIAYMSREVGRMMDELDRVAPNTVVLFHTDHGEELWDHDGFEHNHTLYDEVVRTALWLRPAPGMNIEPRRLSEPVALWDIGPTLTELAGLQGPPTDGRSLVGLATGDDPGGWERELPVAHLMYDVEQWGVVARDHKYVLHTTSGEERLYDLAADPGERRDLSQSTDLEPFRAALSRAHNMPVGPGWRIEVDLRPGEPFVWTLPAPAEHAFVIDPEANRRGRANQVWGERPPVLPEDVATVELSADGTTLTIAPGTTGEGVVGVIFAEPVAPGGELTRNGEVLETFGSSQALRLRSQGGELTARLGTVCYPPPGEAPRMQALEAADADALDLLEALGYIGGGE